MRGGASSNSVSLIDCVLRKAIWLIDDSFLTSLLQSLAHRRIIASLSFYTDIILAFVTLSPPSRTKARSKSDRISVTRCLSSLFQTSIFPRDFEAVGHPPTFCIPNHLHSLLFRNEDQQTGSYMNVPSPLPPSPHPYINMVCLLTLLFVFYAVLFL